jgi:glycosyltransferase involved in cell wall biosynthesis
MISYSTQDVSAVVCTLNSEGAIGACLQSLKDSGVGEIIVVDAKSTDSTTRIASEFANVILEDQGLGLGTARNLGISRTSGALILNMGSDNVMPAGQLIKMIEYLEIGSYHGVSARTKIVGSNYVAQGLNAWRKGRFPTGANPIIGTPTLFVGDTLRAFPYDSRRKFSDDSELCERWAKQFSATFAISDAECLEIGKASWNEVKLRAKMYGISDYEVYSQGKAAQWSLKRKIKSLQHPYKVDFLLPIKKIHPLEGVKTSPFLMAFTFYRYLGWFNAWRQAN